MKLLMTTDTVGGVWTYSLELARVLAPHRVEVLLATMGGRADGRPTPRCRSKSRTSTVAESEFLLEWMTDPWDEVAAAGDWLLELAESYGPDLVHLNNFAHGSLPWNVPVLMVAHSCVLSWHRSVRRHARRCGMESLSRSRGRGTARGRSDCRPHAGHVGLFDGKLRAAAFPAGDFEWPKRHSLRAPGLPEKKPGDRRGPIVGRGEKHRRGGECGAATRLAGPRGQPAAPRRQQPRTWTAWNC